MPLYIVRSRGISTSDVPVVTKTRNSAMPILPRPVTPARLITISEQQLPPVRNDSQVQKAERPEKRSTSQQSIEELLGLGTSQEHLVRKRERLSHLTAEQKLNRRKLKNRVAAQTARDRKKYRTSRLEEAVRTLIVENGKLREENKFLMKKCEELSEELQQIRRCSGDGCGSLSSIGSAESIHGPQQREQAMTISCYLTVISNRLSMRSAVRWMMKMSHWASMMEKESSSSAPKYSTKLIAILRRRIALIHRSYWNNVARLEWIAHHRISL